MELGSTRFPLERLACVNPDCQDYGVTGAGNLYVRKIYGKDHIRYLHCCTCQEEWEWLILWAFQKYLPQSPRRTRRFSFIFSFASARPGAAGRARVISVVNRF